MSSKIHPLAIVIVALFLCEMTMRCEVQASCGDYVTMANHEGTSDGGGSAVTPREEDAPSSEENSEPRPCNSHCQGPTCSKLPSLPSTSVPRDFQPDSLKMLLPGRIDSANNSERLCLYRAYRTFPSFRPSIFHPPRTQSISLLPW